MSSAPLPLAADDLIACPSCDALFRLTDVPDGARARCTRCHAVLLAPKGGSVRAIVSLASGALVLMIASISFPFLHIEASGLSSQASVIDAIRSYAVASGMMAPLSAILLALIVVLPAARLGGLVYALGPLAVGRAPPPHARLAFRVAMVLQPWAMAEIFIIGVAVALIKIAALASVGFGPSFWSFTGLVLLVTAKDTLVCERSIWRLLARS